MIEFKYIPQKNDQVKSNNELGVILADTFTSIKKLDKSQKK